MNPSKAVGEASGEETGIGETMEGVVTLVDAMTSVVDAMEAMMTAVEMKEWLEVGRAEAKRTAAVHFFSRALACAEQKPRFWEVEAPLYWPGHLPGLIQLLSDLLPHNSKDIQSAAMLAIKHLISPMITTHPLIYPPTSAMGEDLESHASEPLIRLVRDTDCTEIRDQAMWLLGRIAFITRYGFDGTWPMALLPFVNDLIRQYAAITEPTEAEMDSLNTAIKALSQVCQRLQLNHSTPLDNEHIRELLPVISGIFQEPVKRKKAQIRAGEVLEKVCGELDGDFLLESGVMGMLVETVRVGKEPTAILIKALLALAQFLSLNDDTNLGFVEALHLVLKRPNAGYKWYKLWECAIECLKRKSHNNPPGHRLEAILSQGGLMELILDMGLGIGDTEDGESLYREIKYLLYSLTMGATGSQIQALMSKGPLFRLLRYYLNRVNSNHKGFELLTVQACLTGSSVEQLRIWRRLADSTGLTDAIRRISLAVPYEFEQSIKELACNILDTYFNNPIPPPPTYKLPPIIYTRNVSY